MSGEKRSPIQIVRDDLNRARRQLTDVQRINRNVQEALKKARQAREKDRRQHQEELNRRNYAFQQSINSLEGSMREMEQRQFNSMLKMQDQFQSRMANQAQEFGRQLEVERQERRENIQKVVEWTQENLNQQREEYLEIARNQQQEIQTVKKDVQNIFSKEARNKDTAKQYIEDLEQQISNTDSNLPHNRFAPNKLDKIRNQLAIAKKNLQDGQEQTALSGAQQRYFDLTDLRLEVEEKEQEFMMWYDTTIEAGRVLLDIIQSNKQVQLREEAPTADVNYWTNGDYAQLEEEANQLFEKLQTGKEDLSLEEVREYLNKINDLTKKQGELVQEAIERIISSELRAVMADTVVKSLEESGFKVVSRGYEKDEPNQIYLVKLRNMAETEIVVAIVPDEETNINTLSVNTKDPRILNEAYTMERFQAIRAKLRKTGFELGEIIPRKEHIEEFYDVENLIQKGSKGIPRKVLEKAKLLNKRTRNS